MLTLNSYNNIWTIWFCFTHNIYNFYVSKTTNKTDKTIQKTKTYSHFRQRQLRLHIRIVRFHIGFLLVLHRRSIRGGFFIAGRHVLK